MCTYQCFCGAAYGNDGCVDKHGGRYGYCPKTELGGGHWHVALPRMKAMDPRKLAQRYPGLRLQELERHVARYKRKKDARGSGRVWSSQKSRSPSHGTQADAPREADRERHPRVRFVPREASSGAASSTRRAWGPKAAGKPGEASSSAAEVQGEPESGDTRQKSVDAWTVLSSDDSDSWRSLRVRRRME